MKRKLGKAKKYKFILLLLIVCFFAVQSYAQQEKKDTVKIRKNSIYLELAGSSFIGYSLNYDRTILNIKKHRFDVGIGLEAFLLSGFLPHINYTYGRGNNYFETGFSYNITKTIYSGKFNYYSYRMGYKYIAANGFIFKVAFTPLINVIDEYYILPWGGVSFGYNFKNF